MKLQLLFLLLILPVFLEATSNDPKAWWGRRHRRRRPRPRPRPKPRPRPLPHHGHYNYRHACKVNGDPHYKTFDNAKYDFQGECSYVYVTDACHKTASGKPALATFKVIAIHANCGRRVSCIKSVDVFIKGKKIHLKRSRNDPAKNYGPFSITYVRNHMIVSTNPPALQVKWNMNMGLEIVLTQAYRRKVCGLCGNFDGHIHNDIPPKGRRRELFFNSWKVAGRNCKVDQPAPQHPCEKNPDRRALAEKDCAIIRSNNFKSCKAGGVDTETLYHNCMFDVCAEDGSDKDSSCEAIKEAAEECKETTGQTVSLGHLEKTCNEAPPPSSGTSVKLFSSCETKRCVFPFTKDGKEYYQCVHSDVGHWCSSEKIATPDSIGLCLQ